MSLFAAVAAKERVGVFDRQTYGCWGGGTGMGFGRWMEESVEGSFLQRESWHRVLQGEA